MKPTITGLVLTGNSQRLLDKCLGSMAFCDEILVVDCFSSDATLDIAKRHGARVVSNAWPGYAAQHAFAQANVRTDWVLILDSDEICTPELADMILGAINNDQGIVGYYVQRRCWYMDRFMDHSGWWPDRLCRLFRRDSVKIATHAIHQEFVPQGPSADLPGLLVHYPYSGFVNQLDKLNEYSQGGAEALRRKGRKGGILRGLGHAYYGFFWMYVLKLGFLDGRAGFMAAAHRAIYAFLKYTRIPEYSWGAPYDHYERKKPGENEET